jgi:ribosome assembly protein YihI (activator of Der GTPase)
LRGNLRVLQALREELDEDRKAKQPKNDGRGGACQRHGKATSLDSGNQRKRDHAGSAGPAPAVIESKRHAPQQEEVSEDLLRLLPQNLVAM